MQHVCEKRRLLQIVTVTSAVVAALALSACGGGDDDDGSPPAAGGASTGGTSPGGGSSTAAIRVEGQSQSLSSQHATVRVLMPPAGWNGGQMPNGKYAFGSLSQPASTLTEQAPGAYVAIPFLSSGEIKTLTKGVVTDLAGNGDIAIGRWADGADSAGESYNANQGQAWAVGAPVVLEVPLAAQMQCSLAFATRPTSADGNTAPGKVNGATAVLTNGKDAFGRDVVDYALNLQYSIGGDQNQSFDASASLGGVALRSPSKTSLMSTVMGSDPKQPYLVVSYGFPATTTGNVNGLAVLSCK
ncbi:hypothetical protein Bsp3421_004643 [Burkholderia sp. FERM BP-3421]|jgi:hypothetical protein|uniref:hypothetical protein n=1 Tax=Burkholderia sp. FERM BP-3421 TaxID=1494466 RepID=UPI0023610A9E|nr:hypothetical protein [Burkholderia sp. FERM BP-3421]WDD94515.1 hypothetical protein Bsp3421_004643 [Burkholderia sp. FERM BP-3421]